MRIAGFSGEGILNEHEADTDLALLEINLPEDDLAAGVVAVVLEAAPGFPLGLVKAFEIEERFRDHAAKGDVLGRDKEGFAQGVELLFLGIHGYSGYAGWARQKKNRSLARL